MVIVAIFLLIIIAAAFVFFVRKANSYATAAPDGGQMAMVLHTHCSLAGWTRVRAVLVLPQAIALARERNIPIILAGGGKAANEQAEVHTHDLIAKAGDLPLQIIDRPGPCAADTATEVRTATMIIKEEIIVKTRLNIFVLALRPHLPLVQYCWSTNAGGVRLEFVAVEGPRYYFLLEFAVFVIECLCAPATRWLTRRRSR